MCQTIHLFTQLTIHTVQAGHAVQIQMNLPPELITLIIDNLSNCLNSLKHCSLVCRVWTTYTRRHLLRSISFRLSSSISKHEARTRSQDFILFVTRMTYTPGLIGCVERFTLDVSPTTIDHDFLYQIVNPIVSSLPFRELRFLEVHWNRFMDENGHLTALIARSPLLETLLLDGPLISNEDELEAFLGLRSPNIRTLCLHNVNMTRVFTIREGTSLFLSAFASKLASKLEGSVAVPQLRKLSLCPIGTEIIHKCILNPAMRMYEPTHLRLASNHINHDLLRDFALSFQSITSLTLELGSFNSLGTNNSLFPNLIRLQVMGVKSAHTLISVLSETTTVTRAPRLQRIHLHLRHVHPPTPLPSLDDSVIKSVLDPYLYSLLLPRQQRVTLTIEVSTSYEPRANSWVAKGKPKRVFSRTSSLPNVTIRMKATERWWGKARDDENEARPLL
ncbi:hypothetical protein Moror_3392 [Moniliophthora roreri MCA 2997]|uniref:F-box domain-containing protein n=2 Tax=Moniliophthora roreri TaxID=221103 RepID=V2X2B2_MONRO|nr:hypothetical protein Moror_3392 [Moniliophthora roreri MCA 2997]